MWRRETDRGRHAEHATHAVPYDGTPIELIGAMAGHSGKGVTDRSYVHKTLERCHREVKRLVLLHTRNSKKTRDKQAVATGKSLSTGWVPSVSG
jgi:hypothetical protein